VDETNHRESQGVIGKAGDPLPAFKNHMIRQRVDRHGVVYHLEPASELPACQLPPSEIGVIKEAPVRKWMAAKLEWDTKYASAKRRVQMQRAKEMRQGYQQFGDGEVPPPSALAGRRKIGVELKEEKKTRSIGLSMWALWGSKHDEKTMHLEQEHDKAPETKVANAEQGAGARGLDDMETSRELQIDARKKPEGRSRSRRRTVRDENQTGSVIVDENTTAAELLVKNEATQGEAPNKYLTPDFAVNMETPSIFVSGSPLIDESDLKRPKHNGIAYPFTVKKHGASASMTTLTSTIGIPPTEDILTEGAISSGVPQNQSDIEAAMATGNRRTKVESTEDNTIISVGKGKETMLQDDASESLNAITYHDGGVRRNLHDLTIIGNGTNNSNLMTKQNDDSIVTHSDLKASPVVLSGGKVVENGSIVSAERPPLDTFVTALDNLPTAAEETDLLELRLRED